MEDLLGEEVDPRGVGPSELPPPQQAQEEEDRAVAEEAGAAGELPA